MLEFMCMDMGGGVGVVSQHNCFCIPGLLVWGLFGGVGRETENMKPGLLFYEGPSIGSLGFLRLSLFTNLKHKTR